MAFADPSAYARDGMCNTSIEREVLLSDDIGLFERSMEGCQQTDSKLGARKCFPICEMHSCPRSEATLSVHGFCVSILLQLSHLTSRAPRMSIRRLPPPPPGAFSGMPLPDQADRPGFVLCSVQPIKETADKQAALWCQLILQYCKHQKVPSAMTHVYCKFMRHQSTAASCGN